MKMIKMTRLAGYKCDEVKITLKTDTNFFYDFKVEPVGTAAASAQAALPPPASVAESATKVKARIVINQNDFSVLIMDKGKKTLLKDSNGKSSPSSHLTSLSS